MALPSATYGAGEEPNPPTPTRSWGRDVRAGNRANVGSRSLVSLSGWGLDLIGWRGDDYAEQPMRPFSHTCRWYAPPWFRSLRRRPFMTAYSPSVLSTFAICGRTNFVNPETINGLR